MYFVIIIGSVICTSPDVGVHLAVQATSTVVKVNAEVVCCETLHQVRHASLLRVVRDRVVPEVRHCVSVDADQT